MAAIEKLIERSKGFDKGISFLEEVRATLEAMKNSDQLRLDTWDEELDAGILEFRFCGVQMYARLEIRSKVQILNEDGPTDFSNIPVFVWGIMHRSHDGRYIASDRIESAYHKKVLLVGKENGAFTLRGTEGQELLRILAEVVLSLIA